MSGILCLKWNNHNSTFLQTLDCLRTKELYCDATLACCGNYYPVHRFVLTTCSDYFEEIFSRTPCKHPFIILKDLDNLQLEALLNYMYKGEVNVLQENLPGLIRAAETLKVKGLAVSDEEIPNKKQEKKSHHSSSRHHLPHGPEHKRRTSNPVREEKEKAKPSPPAEAEENESANVNITSSVPNPTEESEAEVEESFLPDSVTNDDNTPEECEDFSPRNDPLLDDGEMTHSFEDYIKREPDDLEEPIEEKFQVTNETDSHTFMSLLDPTIFSDKDPLDVNQALNGFSIPQCSSWTDNLANPDALHKEILAPSWLQSEYESFPIDDTRCLSANGTSSPNSIIFEESTPHFKEERRKHIRVGLSTGKKSKYMCNDCNFNTNDKAAFRLHMMRKHTGEKPFACGICSYRCTTKDMLKIHTRKHTGERPFSCPYCTCRMAVKSSLKRHILLKHIQCRKPKSQTSVFTPSSLGTLKTYKCTDCSYESQMKSNLKLHYMRIHTGEKPIACTMCPYRTTTKPQLEKHMRKHTGEKPFACTFCSYKAAQKHSLLRHMILHTK